MMPTIGGDNGPGGIGLSRQWNDKTLSHFHEFGQRCLQQEAKGYGWHISGFKYHLGVRVAGRLSADLYNQVS